MLWFTSAQSPAVPEQLGFSFIWWWPEIFSDILFFSFEYQDFGLFIDHSSEGIGVFGYFKLLFWEPEHPEDGVRPLLWLFLRSPLEESKRRPDWNRSLSGSLLHVFNSHTHMAMSSRGDLDFLLWCRIPCIPLASQEQRGHFKAFFFFFFLTLP